MPRKQKPTTVSRLLNLPPELRSKIYEAVMDGIIEGGQRVFWVPDVLEGDVYKHPTMAMTYHKGWRPRRVRKGPFLSSGYAHPSIHHNDISSLVCLGQACKMLREETAELAWQHADLTAQGSFAMIRALLGPRLVLSVASATRASIKTLQHIIYAPWKKDGPRAMEQMVQIINSHLPQLERLTVSYPHIMNPFFNLKLALSSTDKAALATLLKLSPELNVTFYAYDSPGSYPNIHLFTDERLIQRRNEEMIKLLTEKAASNRLIWLDRKRRRKEREGVDPVHYIWKNLGLLSFAYLTIDKERFCCFDHEVKNYLSVLYKRRSAGSRCVGLRV